MVPPYHEILRWSVFLSIFLSSLDLPPVLSIIRRDYLYINYTNIIF